MASAIGMPVLASAGLHGDTSSPRLPSASFDVAQQLPPQPDLPTQPPPALPDPEDLLRSPDAPSGGDSLDPSDAPSSDPSLTLFVERFEVTGSTVFSDDEIAAVLAPYTGRELSLSELYAARTALTQLYIDAGYVLSGAYIPPQEPENDVVRIEVIEGRLDAIDIQGNRRLRSQYIRNRLALADGPPLNLDDLVEQLRLLQLNPLIENISGELATGLEPGTGVLNVMVEEADSFTLDVVTNNDRTPVVGSWQRGFDLVQANLTERGDRLQFAYTNTNGSNEIDASYTLPVNPRNGSVTVRYGLTDSYAIEEPFDILGVNSESRYYELSYRQPIIETPSQELALGLTASRQESRSLFLEDLLGDPIPFPALGADEEGRIRASALRFSQDWTHQGAANVIALRSQFNVGLDVFDPTINSDAPDSRFVSWNGQAQWANLLAEDTLLLLRAEAQLTRDALVPLERFGLGGRRTVRGYRQDVLLTDNGVLASAEVRVPIYRNRNRNSLVQVVPFIDVGTGWNADGSIAPATNTIVGTGLGIRWLQGDRFSAQFVWGIPLTEINQGEGTLQEDGLYFSLRYNLL